ncbi:hypothetical protein EKH57_11795 [Halorubrum sp. BOL3-1]|uniref:DUF7268 family protein n=1 Tax=Halorubrum sp. BOL3-1 TaxID=2497325 RepID=UPI001004E5E4|nr:hypothetical protein [Halorubrum sp. BOL3-1]QAU13346.1 hypothetical protein EKH57_11795 [Halorubrum sp. BOL3-1]
MTESDRRPTGRTVARWVGSGALLGCVAAAALLPVLGPRGATDTSFALGVLVFGFGVATWGGTVGFGDSMAAVQDHLGGESGWNPEGARQAFAVLTWVGAGWSAAAVSASIALVGL